MYITTFHLPPHCIDLADVQVPVACTPNGLADAATYLSIDDDDVHTAAHATTAAPSPQHATQKQLYFALPHEETVTMRDLATHLAAAAAAHTAHFDTNNNVNTPPHIWYLQPQNNSLVNLIPPPIQPSLTHPTLQAWATHMFGTPPDAINLWIGDARSHTSFHKDHYENIYHVLHGTKRFVLYPPCDVWYMQLRALPTAQWTRVGGDDGDVPGGELQLRPLPDAPPVVWSVLDVGVDQGAPSSTLTPKEPPPPPQSPPQPSPPSPFVAMVHANEVLYLPSLWFHSVSHVPCAACTANPDVIAVNYWFDMQYDVKFAYFKALDRAAGGGGDGCGGGGV